jgi:hypothetical protein
MQVWIDNIWSTPSHLHFRVCTQGKQGWRVEKHHVALRLEDLDAVFAEHFVDAQVAEIDPTRDDRQIPLWP